MARDQTAPAFTAEQLDRLVRWSVLVLVVLAVTIFGAVFLAWKKAQSDACSGKDARCGKCAAVEECEETAPAPGECGRSATGKAPGPHRPPPPRSTQPAGLNLDFDLNVGAQAAESGTNAGGGQGAATQTVIVNGVPVPARPSSAAPGQEASGGGGATQTVTIDGVPMSARFLPGSGENDLVVVLDREKEVVRSLAPRRRWKGEPPRGEDPPLCKAPTDPPGDSNPCAQAELLGRVRFDHGSRTVTPTRPDPIGGILGKLGDRTGSLLVIGHGDNCGEQRLAERRAARTRRELRRLLRNRMAWKSGDLRLHSQAAGKEGGAPESTCRPAWYGTTGVYLIEGLK